MAEQIKKVLTIEIDVESGEVKKLGSEVKKVADNTKKAEKGVGGLAGGFKKVGTAMKAAGIGLVIALLATLKEIFGENQAIADTFSTAMTGLKIAFNDFFQFVSGNLSTITGAFTKIFDDPVGSIKALGEAIKDNIIERFNSLLDTLGYAGDALKKFFEGDFNGAIESAKQAGKELVDVYTGVNNSFDRTVDFVSEATNAIIDYTTETWKSADALTEQAKATNMLELEQQRLREQYDRDAENLRQIRDDESKSFEERIEANRRLGEVLNEQQLAEQETVKKRIANIQNLQTQLGFNQERYEQIYALQTELIAIEAQQAGFRSEQLTNENSLLREQADYEKGLIDDIAAAKKKADDEEADRIKKLAEDRKAAQDASFSVAASTLSALSALNDAFVKDDEASKLAAFKRQKALGIASAIISTSEAAINAFKSTVGIPIVGPALAPIAAAAAIAAGVAQVQNIRKQEYNGGSSSAPSVSPSGGSGALSQAPQFNTVGTSGFNQLSDSIAGQNNRPVQAYVVANNVSSAQSLERNRVQQASFP
jgi:hypothetical protein